MHIFILSIKENKSKKERQNHWIKEKEGKKSLQNTKEKINE